MTIAAYFVDFIAFSFIGWIYECIYCTVKTKHWQNRGFLFGPICPIYGSGAVAAMYLFGSAGNAGLQGAPLWKIFLICAAGSAILEYVTSWVLEKCFHAVWWEYSDVPLNLNGRISLPTSCGFGAAGILVVRVLVPLVAGLHQEAHPVLNEFLALLFMLLLGADLALTVSSLTRLLSRIEEIQNDFNNRLEAGVEIAQQGPRAIAAAAAAAGGKAKEKAVAAAAGRVAEVKEFAGMTRQEITARLRKRGWKPGLRDMHHVNAIRMIRNGIHRPLALILYERMHKLEEKLLSPLDRAVLRDPEDRAEYPAAAESGPEKAPDREPAAGSDIQESTKDSGSVTKDSETIIKDSGAGTADEQER